MKERGLTSTKSLKTQKGVLWSEGGASTLLHSHRVQLVSACTSDQKSPSPEQQAGWFQKGMNDVYGADRVTPRLFLPSTGLLFTRNA